MIGSETHLVIRQPYLEGMLPYEYAIILKALKQLAARNISLFFEASAVSNESLNGHVHRISNYYNKRFYKYTETGRDYHAEIPLPSDEETKDGKTLFISEGNLLPSKTELNLAAKSKFDLYTITNLSVADLAAYLSMHVSLFAVAKADLGNQDEVVAEFSSSPFLTASSVSPVASEEPAAIARRPVDLKYNEVIDLTHSRDCIYQSAERIKAVLGRVDHLAVFERETFEVVMHELAGSFKVEASVRLNLKDYRDTDKHVDLVKVSTNAGQTFTIVSETLSYQSHVPFQSLMLPLRVSHLKFNFRSRFSAPRPRSSSHALTSGTSSGPRTLRRSPPVTSSS